jgi:hypothetical protein
MDMNRELSIILGLKDVIDVLKEPYDEEKLYFGDSGDESKSKEESSFVSSDGYCKEISSETSLQF